MSGPVKISVVMPVFNNEKTLPESIESILNQTYDDFEFIIIDDGSTDTSNQILIYYANTDSRINILTNGTNQGIYYSRNRGNAAAKGEFIAVMNADDISFTNRFEEQINFLDKNPEINVVGSQIIVVDSEGKHLKKSSYPLTPGLIRWGLFFGNQFAHPTVMIRRKVFQEYGYEYGSRQAASDFELWTKLSTFSKLANLDQPLLFYRQREDNISNRKHQVQLLETYDIIRLNIFELIGANLTDELIKGFMHSKHVKSLIDAKLISKIVIKLEKTTGGWDITRVERKLIRKQAAHKLRSIYQACHYDILLTPYVFYSLILNLRSVLIV